MKSGKGRIVLSAGFLLAVILSFFPRVIFGQLEAPQRPRWMELGDKVEASEIDSSQYPFFTKWLDEFGKVPLDYALKKCREHQVIIFGELHGVKDYLDFFLKLIPEAYHKAGMRVVVLEAFKYEQSADIEKLVEGITYDRKLALEIARSVSWPWWNYKEYVDIFEVVWKLNKSLPPDAEHMKVIGMDVGTDNALNRLYRDNKLEDRDLIQKARVENMFNYVRDEWMAGVVEENVIRKKTKGLVWVGLNHSFTHYAQPAVNKDGILVHDWPRLGNLLYRNYQDKIFQISFHYPAPDDSPKIIFDKYDGGNPVLGGLIEKIMAERGNKPVGFDVFSSPFANIRDSRSYLFYFQPYVRFSDITRGYIFITPWDKRTKSQKIKNFISDEMFKKYKRYFETTYKRSFKNAREVNEILEKD